MPVFNVDPVTGPQLASRSASTVSPTTSGISQEAAQTFSAILQAQMSSLITSSALGGLGSDGGSSGFGGLSSGLGGLGGGFGGIGGGGGGGGLDSSLQSLLLMQTLAPLTEAINALSARLDALDGSSTQSGAQLGPQVDPVNAPGTLPYVDVIERLAESFQVPAAFLGAVMMAESGGDPNAVGDNGASVGLFQLHDQGMGQGLGELRLDPELNAAVGARGLAEGWHAGLEQGLSGEELVRSAYDHSFNPGGGFGWQGDSVYSYFRFYENLAAREPLPAAGVIAASAPANADGSATELPT